MRHQVADRDVGLVVALEAGNVVATRDRSAGSGRPRPASSRSWSSPRPWSATRGRTSCRASSASGAGATARWPIAFSIHDPIAAADEHHRARQLLVGDRLLDQRWNRVEPCQVEPGGGSQATLGCRTGREKTGQNQRNGGRTKGGSHHSVDYTFWVPSPFSIRAQASKEKHRGTECTETHRGRLSGPPGPAFGRPVGGHTRDPTQAGDRRLQDLCRVACTPSRRAKRGSADKERLIFFKLRPPRLLVRLKRRPPLCVSVISVSLCSSSYFCY